MKLGYWVTQRRHLLFFVPKSKSNILKAMRIRDTGNAILTPSESSGARMIVWEICGHY
jgi:hypothetical protein